MLTVEFLLRKQWSSGNSKSIKIAFKNTQTAEGDRYYIKYNLLNNRKNLQYFGKVQLEEFAHVMNEK